MGSGSVVVALFVALTLPDRWRTHQTVPTSEGEAMRMEVLSSPTGSMVSEHSTFEHEDIPEDTSFLSDAESVRSTKSSSLLPT